MRIASWNCRMGFWGKWEYLASFDPDVMVVPEGASPSRLTAELLQHYPHSLWTGGRDVQGLLVLSKQAYPLTRIREASQKYRFVLPVAVGAPEPFTLIAVWAQRDSWGRYTDHVMEALRESEDLLTGDVVVAGDFNSNAIWDDQLGTSATHSEIVEWLGARNLASAYHRATGEAQGSELLPTYAQHKDPDRLFHIDHCFLSASLLDRGATMTVAPIESWIELSDHAPLIVDLP